jgi:hypothetical protein
MAGRAPLTTGPIAIAVAAAVALLVAGCGGGSASTASTGPQVPPVALSIDEPDGGAVAARAVDGRWVAAVTVAGRSQPGSILRVTTGCAAAACTGGAEADEAGAWHVRLRAEARPAKPYARLIAELAGESAVGLARLEGPRAPRGSAARGSRKSGRSAGSGGSASPADRVDGVPVPPPPATLPDSTDPLPGATPGSAGGGASSLLLVGDSLAVGIQPLLPGQLPGWTVLTDAREDRTLSEGMARWRVERGDEAVDAFSLFTNDSPRSLTALEAAVRETARDGCAVWATIARRTANGDSYGAANDLLGRLAAELPGRLVVVPWAAAVAEHPDWLGRDGVHPNQTGYRARAQLYAQAARSCA